MNKKSPLLEYEDNWPTYLGAIFPGERVVLHGKDLFSELSDKSWMELLLFSITGRAFTQKQLRLFEGIWTICTSYPDPRIWNNRVAALVASTRGTGSLGLGAATAVTEASIYGMKPIIKSFDFLIKTQKDIESGLGLEKLVLKELKRDRVISGYGRPIVKRDERIEPLMKLANKLEFRSGKYINLAFSVEKVLKGLGYRMQANIAAISAGLVADQGLSSREYYYYLINCFSAGIIACYIDAANKLEGAIFPLRCDRISYEGSNCRLW